MAVSARFEADFSQFVAATKTAEVALGKVEQGGSRVGRSFTNLEGGATGAAAKVDKFAISVGQADVLLGRFGINIPPAVRGLLDLGNMALAAKVGVAGVGAAAAPAAAGAAAVGTASVGAAAGLGAMAAGAAIAGTALASWKLGTLIGEIGGKDGLTQSIADGTAKMLGWGDVAGQEAAAGADVLARASKTAGVAITDVGVAMAINQQEAERLIAKNHATGASFVKLAADIKVAEAAMVALSKAKVEAQGRSVMKEHELTVALQQREADKAGEKFGSITIGADGKYKQTSIDPKYHAALAPSVATAVTTKTEPGAEMDLWMEQVRSEGRAAQENDIARSQARMAATSTTNVYVSGVFNPADASKIADVVGKVQTRRGLTERRW